MSNNVENYLYGYRPNEDIQIHMTDDQANRLKDLTFEPAYQIDSKYSLL